MNYDILNTINSPDELKRLNEDEKLKLCGEIREFLIDKVGKTGGHLASNLGVVELSVALHSVFDSPKDRIIFDVGHQAYVHKILTGRREGFDNLRSPGGISGFTLRRESEHDPFGAGHSSTAISAALGFAEADLLSGNDAYNIAVVGDGAFTGGMIHEALNNVRRDLKLIIVLNENRMSISKNKGAVASYLAKVRISKGYMSWKRGTKSVLSKIPLIGKPIRAFLAFVKNKLKRIVYANNYFEDLGLYYIGPVNGNDYATVERALREAKRTGKSAIIHTYTKKGKGYEPAERSPDYFHSVYSSSEPRRHFHNEFADELCAIAADDEKICAVTAAMGIGTGLDSFGQKYPKRYFDVGIAEAHALTFSAALCAAGMKPYVAIYSTFLQRGYDNVLHDIALQNLPVRIMIDRAGLAASDGATHHGIFDVSFLSHIPGIDIYSPATFGSLRAIIRSTVNVEHPVAIRYPNSTDCKEIDELFYPEGDYENFGVRADFKEAPELVFVSYGAIAKNVIRAKEILTKNGINSGIVLVECLKPHKEIASKIAELTAGARALAFVEEGILNGGFSMIMRGYVSDVYPELKIAMLAIDDCFASPDVSCNIYDYVGLSAEKIAEAAAELYCGSKN